MATLTEDVEALRRRLLEEAVPRATALRAYHMAKEALLPGWLAHAMLTRV